MLFRSLFIYQENMRDHFKRKMAQASKTNYILRNIEGDWLHASHQRRLASSKHTQIVYILIGCSNTPLKNGEPPISII
jgi:hypothetical protein